MNNKTLYTALVALPVAVGAPMGGAAFASTTQPVNITRTGASSNTNIQVLFNPSGVTGTQAGTQTNTQVGNNWPLRRQSNIQLSAGVVLSSAASNGPDDAGNFSNIVVGTAHTDGSAAFGGSTRGGSVTECPTGGGSTNCPNAFTTNAPDAANIANTAFSNL